jgi:hypothetical protein
MDKKLQEQLLDAGILPKNGVRQMEQWQNVPAGSAGKIGKFDPAKIKALKEDLELRSMPTLRESILDVDKLINKGRMVSLSHEGVYSINCKAGVDVLKRYIFEIPRDPEEYKYISALMRPLSMIVDDALPEPFNRRVITEISVLYSTIAQGASVPTHWFCVTESRGEESIVRGR